MTHSRFGPILNRVLRFGQTTDRVPDPVVLDMHAKSGLLAECSESTLTVADVEGELLDLVPEVADKDDRPVLAGFGVHFDHGFLRVHMPRLAARLHYRHYDVTPVGFFCRSLGMGKIPKAHAHRAREDVLESIEYGEEVRRLVDVARSSKIQIARTTVLVRTQRFGRHTRDKLRVDRGGEGWVLAGSFGLHVVWDEH